MLVEWDSYMLFRCRIFWVQGTDYFRGPLDTPWLSPVTTGAQKNQEADEEESSNSGQTAPQDDLHLPTAQHAPRGAHGGRAKWHTLMESVSPSDGEHRHGVLRLPAERMVCSENNFSLK